MASPPHVSPSTSPPYPAHMSLPNNPRKRPSLQFTHPQQYNPSKRRKQASIASGASSAHPLRQTSFPPEEALTGERSPSVDSDFSGLTGEGGRSVLASESGATKGKRKVGRKKGRRSSKADKLAENYGSGGGREGRDSLGGTVPPDAGYSDDDDEDDDGGAEALMMDDGDDMDKAAERKNLSVLVDAFNHDQAERYEMFRRVKLRKETVRRIANFTLAQSVPPAVITTINGYTKTFVGTLIERAREVQKQWAAIETPPTSPPKMGNAKEEHEDSQMSHSEKELGPLLPDHLREALRRHKRDGETDATGLTGVSVGLGNPGTGSARLQGRRLFR